jgi:NAD(P)-dependent dehydrogenase (short-subunit alcohol dehydrogenase family)
VSRPAPAHSRVAIVTGASRGIGRGIARELASDGVHVILAARDEAALDDVAGEIRAGGGRADAYAVDLRAVDAAERVVSFALARGGRLDILVNNAGATKRAEFVQLSDEDWADGFALKFFGAVRLCRAAWPHLKASRGSVLNIAGVGGRTPGAAFAVGGSVNAALLSFTKALAETGLVDGVQVNAVNPGAIRTDRLRKRLAALAAAHDGDAAAAEAEFVRRERVTRIGEPEDIAHLVAFIVGPRGRFLHGALIDADGGATKTL